MVKCPNCGAEVVGSDFCFNCGEKVDKTETPSDICPKCGAKNDKNTNFCRECGYKLEMVHPFLLNKENGMLNVMKFLHVMINLQRTSESKMKTTSLPV